MIHKKKFKLRVVFNKNTLFFAKLHVSKFEGKGYNKVTTISLKKHNFINKVTKSNYMFSRKFEKA
jgi:hypothetical protein